MSTITSDNGSGNWSPAARKLLYFVYEFWIENRRPPNLGDVYAGQGLHHREVRRLYRELQAGSAIVAAEERITLGLSKAPPFSATPTPVAAFLDGRFLSYLGCACEAFTVGRLPGLCDQTLELRTHCGCCYQLITLTMQRSEIVSSSLNVLPKVAILGSPWEWEHGVPADRICDSFHFVLDDEHARRLETMMARRGVLLTVAQIAAFVDSVARKRMWDPDWPPVHMDGASTVRQMADLGVDVGLWE